MYGGIYKGSLIPGISPAFREFLAGGTFAAGDFVMLSSGELVVGTASSTLAGLASESATSASTGVQVNITPFALYLMDNDNDAETFVAAHVGEFGDLVGATQLMQIDSNTLSTTKATFKCIAYNPQNMGYDSDTSIGLFELVEYEFSLQQAA